MPKSVNVALALNQSDLAGLAPLLDFGSGRRADLRAAFPAEPVIAFLSKPELDRENLAQRAEIGHANRRVPFVGAVREAAAAQELDREFLGRRIGFKCQSATALFWLIA